MEQPWKHHVTRGCCGKRGNAETGELWVEAISVWSKLELYNRAVCGEPGVRTAENCCVMATSLQVHEPKSRGVSTIASCYNAAQRRLWLRTLVCVCQCSAKCSYEMYKSAKKNLITNPNLVSSHSTCDNILTVQCRSMNIKTVPKSDWRLTIWTTEW